MFLAGLVPASQAAAQAVIGGEAVIAAEAEDESAELSAEKTAEIKQLIENLGAPTFSEREQAAIALQSMGVVALPQLRITLETTEDPEMRERTQQLIKQLSNGRLEEQIKDFMAMKDIKFEGWIVIRNILREDSTATRQLFVDLLKTHPKLPSAMTGTPRDRTIALEASIASIQANQQKQMPTTADAFALLLLILDEAVEMPSACEDLVIGILQKSTASNIRRNRRLYPSFQALLGQWMSRTSLTNREDVLFYGLEWKLGIETRQLALDTLKNGPDTGVLLIASALQALARYGVRTDIATVRSLLDDKRPVTKGSRNIQGERIENQVGDLAIATIASIYDVALDDVGFHGVKTDRTFGYLPNEIGFPVGEPEKRQQARDTIDAILRHQNDLRVPPAEQEDKSPLP